jgi:hypothetical protein
MFGPSRLLGPLVSALLLVTGGCVAIGSVIDQFTGADEVRRLREVGVAAPAEILRIWDTGTTLNEDPVVGMDVEVQPVDGEPFRAVIEKALISRLAIPRYQPGELIGVFYDPNDPSCAVLDPTATALQEHAGDPPGLETRVALGLRLCAKATGDEDKTVIFLVTGPEGGRYQAVRTAAAGDGGVCLRFPDDFGEAETPPGRYRYEIDVDGRLARRGWFEVAE